MVEAQVEQKGTDVFLKFGEFSIKLPEGKAKTLIEGGYDGKTVVMGIRPEDMHDEEVFISQSPDSVIETEVEVTELLGAEVYLYLLCAGQQMTARVNPRSTAKSGDMIKMALDVQRIHVFDKDTEMIVTN